MSGLRRCVEACALAVALAACGDSTGPAIPDLSGEWLFSEFLILGPEDECLASGNVVFAQTGATLGGTATRVSGCAQFTPLGGSAPTGQVTDSGVTFAFGLCQHTGTFQSGSRDSIAGTLTCSTTSVTGTWLAVRVGPAATLVLTPAARTMVIGGTTSLATLLTDAAGHPLFGRAVAWTSDNPAAVTVASSGATSGQATAAGAGSATVTATAGGVSANGHFTVKVVQFTSVSADAYRTCGLSSTGEAWCWGGAVLGDGTGASSLTAVGVAGGLTFASVSNGVNACALATSGAAYCWGQYAGLGGGVPTAVPGGVVFTSLSAGSSDHFCGVTNTGAAMCWGNNTSGQLGNGLGLPSATPVTVLGGHVFASVSSGGYHNCGLTPTGAPWCWGSNYAGALGDGSTTGSAVPVAVAGGLSFTSLSAGTYGTCGIVGGAAYCWGRNEEGQLGIGSTDINPHPTPQPIAGGLMFSMVSSSFSFSCGITTSGAAWCWGTNTWGQLGNGTTTDSRVPVPVSGGLTFALVSVGTTYACGITTGGVAYCWGNNDSGQLGNGSSVGGSVPVRVAGQP